MRYGFLLIVFALFMGCGTSERDQPVSEAPSAPAAADPATPPTGDGEMPATDSDPAESDPVGSDPTEDAAVGSSQDGSAAQQLESTSLEEIQKRVEGNVNDRKVWDLYIAKVAQTAKVSLASDPFESLTIVENALRFCLKQNDKMDDDVRTEVFAQTETVWDPISEEAGKRLEAEAGVDPEE